MVPMLFCSLHILLAIVNHLLSGFRSLNLVGWIMTIWLSVCLFKIHHRSFWKIRACIQVVANRPYMVKKVVEEMHVHKVEIRFVDKMLCNFWLDLRCIFINVTTLCSCRMPLPGRVSLPFLLFVQRTLLFQVFWNLVCRLTGVELTGNIIVMMKILQIIFHVLGLVFCMVPVRCNKVKID